MQAAREWWPQPGSSLSALGPLDMALNSGSPCLSSGIGWEAGAGFKLLQELVGEGGTLPGAQKDSPGLQTSP